ncbi:MAG TPA: O-methyltransferase [Chitinophagaceae bacterium]|nr:O-methyltransferase [Chitinophagaceae bacterium]
MELINPRVQAYAENFTSPEDALLHEIAEQTYKHHPQPGMLSGHWQGKFLELVSYMLAPSRILEIGTFMGYSALCLAKGLLNDGRLHTIELRKDEADIALQNFHKAKSTEKIILHLGNALEIIPTIREEWDLVFIDADKVNYTAYYELVLPLLKKGGFILADNMLFHGEVLAEPVSGKSAKAIHAFNEHVSKDERVEQVLVTIRDGLMLIRKK